MLMVRARHVVVVSVALMIMDNGRSGDALLGLVFVEIGSEGLMSSKDQSQRGLGGA